MTKRTLQYIVGYVVGGLLFMGVAPYGLFLISKILDQRLPLEWAPPLALRLAALLLSIVLFVVGLIFAVSSNVYLRVQGEGGPAEFAGVEISPRTRHLVVRGPYRYTRNPMLFGACMVYYAAALFLHSIPAFGLAALFNIVMMVFVKLTEEKRLLRDFGGEYEAYRAKVPMFFPRLKIDN